jgi:hypothetical protein
MHKLVNSMNDGSQHRFKRPFCTFWNFVLDLQYTSEMMKYQLNPCSLDATMKNFSSLLIIEQTSNVTLNLANLPHIQ